MGANKTRTEYMDLTIVANTDRFCFGNFAKFYDRFIFPQMAFGKIEFAKAMHGDYLTPVKYRAIVFALVKATAKINEGIRDPKNKIEPLVPPETVNLLVAPYIEEYRAVTGEQVL